MTIDQSHIRNFSVIAHVAHGKSTLSDRLIELCGGLSAREMTAQVLNSMELERERGITIKAKSITLWYKAKNGEQYQLNFIDTPGHVDFGYEVSRSLSACEGALLVVDASQGVEAQTLAVCYMAIEQGLEILPVLNKIDLPQIDPEGVIKEIEDIVGLDASEALRVSAKTGVGIAELLEVLIQKIPPPKGDRTAPLQALIIDSWFDSYAGVISLVCIKQGSLKVKDKILVMSTGKAHEVTRLEIHTPKTKEVDTLQAGEVGYIIAGIKDIHGAPVGDTITHAYHGAETALAGFKKVQPQVFAGLFPTDADQYESFREALSKLSLNDASLFFEPENSDALGFGFRCGFLGLLHMEIVQERLEREYNLSLITTAPTVIYEILTTKGEVVHIDSPSKLPAPNYIAEIREPIVTANILVPQEYLGNVMKLCIDKRGVQTKIVYHGKQVALTYDLPMSEVILDFFDRLKSNTRGYGSLDYAFTRFQVADLVKLDILINGEKVDALSFIIHRDRAVHQGHALAVKLKDIVPRQMFDVAIQAAIGSQIIARTNVKALRKNVLAKCYGGDISRKMKLLNKQKEGKKRMKTVGKVDLPQDAFLAVLKIND